MLRTLLKRRYISTVPAARKEGWIYVDSVFPIQLAAWDLRHYIGIGREDFLLDSLRSKFANVKAHDFQLIDLQPYHKDGGVYVYFAYNPPAQALEQEATVQDIERAVRDEAGRSGGFPSWLGMTSGNAWLVQGSPWKEDLRRFASPIVKVIFDGPDVQEQKLYEMFRPYGRIKDIDLPGVVPAGTPRSATITFRQVRSAAIARNVLYGVDLHSQSTTPTRIRTAYQQPIQAHAVRDWMSSHPKIMLPLLVFLLGSLTYTIFDPIRSLMVEGKMLNWFDYREYAVYQWLRANTVDRLGVASMDLAPPPDVWKERSDAQASLVTYLTDKPNTIAFMHGPQGSGKTRLVQATLAEENRSVLYIDCREIQKQTSDSQLVAALATQTGYWPVFTLFNSMGNLIDLATVGLIGQKVGISSSLVEQLTQILTVVGSGLKGVSMAHHSKSQREINRQTHRAALLEQERETSEKIARGTWHDGRIDCVAGNGIMSELGVGDEEFDPSNDAVLTLTADEKPDKPSDADMDAVKAMPVVVIRNYSSKLNGTREELLAVLATWTASLVENQIAHVIILSDNRENAKRVAKALPSKSLYSIGLTDADASSSLSFMRQKLKDTVDLTQEQTSSVARLGGRASDLESLIHKVRNGQSVKDAVEEIINQGVSELRKSAFGDDVDDAKSLPWGREQVWHVVNLLTKRPEISYHDITSDFPFKGDEGALRNMEHAEIISIITKDGRPSAIKPGKPVFRWVFDKLVKDPVFQAVQEINFNEKAAAKAASQVKACEDELQQLGVIMSAEPKYWYSWIVTRRSAARERARYVAEKMLKAEKKVEVLERRNDVLKKGLVNAF